MSSYKITKKTKDQDAIKVDLERKSIEITVTTVNTLVYEEDSYPRMSLQFERLVVADGAKRSVAKALGEEIIFFDETQQPLHHSKHVVATFRIPAETTPYTCAEKKAHLGDEDATHLTPIPLAELRNYGWTGYTRPYSQVYATNDVIYIGAEVPPELDRARAKEYALMLMRDSLPLEYVEGITDIVCDDTKYGQKQKLLSVSIFDIELGDLNLSVLLCGQEDPRNHPGVIFFMGDAKKNPLYTTGTGVQTGIREAMNFNKFLEKENSSLEELQANIAEYHAQTRIILDTISECQDKWILGRQEKEKLARENHLLFKKYQPELLKIKQISLKIDDMMDAKPTLKKVDFCILLQSELRQMAHRYSNIFDYCGDSSAIVSYNGLDIVPYLIEIKEICDSISSKFPAVDVFFNDEAVDEDMSKSVSDLYNEFTETTNSMMAESTEMFRRRLTEMKGVKDGSTTNRQNLKT